MPSPPPTVFPYSLEFYDDPLSGRQPVLESAIRLGVLPFLAGDLFKVLLAAAALPGAWRIVRR